MLNWIWLALILIAVLCAAFTGRMDELTNSILGGAGAAVTLAISLIGVMAFFLGAMRILQDGGFLNQLARKLKPVMAWLFPDVPVEHPAMSAMILNISSNILGLGNAATPFGIKAMTELEKLNDRKGTATNAMCLFLAMNTSALALLPSGVISIRAALHSSQPAAIFFTTIVATACSTTIAIIAAKALQRLPMFSAASAAASLGAAPSPEPDPEQEEGEPEEPDTETGELPEVAPRKKAHIAVRISLWVFVALFVGALGLHLAKELGPPRPNVAPTTQAQSVTVERNESQDIDMVASDPDKDDELTFEIVESPEHGTLSGAGPKFTYTPADDFTGTDRFTYTVSDGEHTTEETAIAIKVVAPPPVTFTSRLGDALRGVASFWFLPALIVAILLYGVSRRVKIYESLVEGAKEGFNVAVIIIPYLVAILVAVSMFRASGAMEIVVNALSPVTDLIGMPAEALPMALVRPLSGQGAMGVMVEIMQHNGPDSFVGLVVSTMQGSTDTTFYILAVYFGAAQIRATRHAVPACLIADLAGVTASVAICWVMFAGRGL